MRHDFDEILSDMTQAVASYFDIIGIPGEQMKSKLTTDMIQKEAHSVLPVVAGMPPEEYEAVISSSAEALAHEIANA